jgi:hypothetical protein
MSRHTFKDSPPNFSSACGVKVVLQPEILLLLLPLFVASACFLATYIFGLADSITWKNQSRSTTRKCSPVARGWARFYWMRVSSCERSTNEETRAWRRSTEQDTCSVEFYHGLTCSGAHSIPPGTFVASHLNLWNSKGSNGHGSSGSTILLNLQFETLVEGQLEADHGDLWDSS